MKLSVIVPHYNEGPRLNQSIINIDSYLRKNKIDSEIVLVSDGGKDSLATPIEGVKVPIKLIKHKKNMGKGAAIRTGVFAASGEYLLFMDADESTKINEVMNFLKNAKPDKILIASRHLKNSTISEQQSALRVFLGKASNLLTRILVLPGIHDTQCGFKFFSQEAGKKIFERQTINRFAFDIEMLVIARIMGYKIKEMPIVWHDSKKSTVNYKDYLLCFKDLLIIKYNVWSRKYYD